MSTQKPSGRLVAWLVSYAQEKKGTTFEIRTGRSLVSSDDLGSDRLLLVTGKGVSSPHAALSANTKHRILLQDIFTEHGTYITRSDSTEERKVSSPTELHHGDWIRVGEKIRFQVCMIDGTSR